MSEGIFRPQFKPHARRRLYLDEHPPPDGHDDSRRTVTLSIDACQSAVAVDIDGQTWMLEVPERDFPWDLVVSLPLHAPPELAHQ